MFYFNIVFLVLCTLLLILLILKCYEVDGTPDQTQAEKLDKCYINELISVFGILNQHKKALVHETNIEEEKESNTPK
jgi:hypothetical protein